MSRMTELQARRALLLERCAQQRLQLARHVTQLRGALPGAPWARSAGAGILGQGARHPLAWLAFLAALVAFGRTRRVLSAVVLLRSVLTFGTRTAALLKVLTEWRAAVRARAQARGPGAAAAGDTPVPPAARGPASPHGSG
jgi:hypothetical protein